MPIMHWRPFHDLDRFFDEDFVPFLPVRRLFEPAADIYEVKDSVVVEMPLSGIDSDKVEISVEDDLLTVKGEMEEKKEEKDKNYYRKEIRRGSFARTLALPRPVKGDQAEAQYENGILKVTIPKEERAKPKKIAVRVKK